MTQADMSDATPSTVTWDSIHRALVERVWTGLFVLAAIGMPLSLLRMTLTGWLFSYGVHLVMGLLVYLLTWFRKHIPTAVKAAVVVMVLAVITSAGMFNFGFLSQPALGLVVYFLLSGLLFSRRIAIFCSIAYTLLMATIGVGYITGRLHIAFDANLYTRSAQAWVFLFFGVVLFGSFIVAAISVYKDSIRTLLREVEQQRDRIAHQATHDRLTGLPSLRLAVDRLDMAIHAAQRNDHKAALMFIDLDGFKLANDTYGHEGGDVVLQEVARRLATAVRTSDTVARIGGDEFLVILGELSEPALAAESARRIIDALSVPIPFSGQQITVGCSIGIAVYPDHATDAIALRRAADLAMYAVKNAGKNHFQFALDQRKVPVPSTQP